MNPWIWVILLSIAPVVELRGSIPFGFFNGLNIYLVFLLSVVFNSLASIITFLFLDFIHEHLMKVSFYKRTFDAFMERTRKKVHSKIQKYGYLGLAIFVAIPLPGTGAYTGAVAAWFFGMDKWKAFWSIALGVLVAGIIVTAGLLTGNKVLSMFIGR